MDIILIIITIFGGILVLLMISSPIIAKFVNKYEEWECFNKDTELPQAQITYKQLHDFYVINPSRYFSEEPQYFNRLYVISETGKKILHIQLTFKDWNRYIKDLQKFRTNKIKQEQLQKEKDGLKLFLSIVQSDIDKVRQKEAEEINKVKSLTEELSKPIKLTLDKKENLNVRIIHCLDLKEAHEYIVKNPEGVYNGALFVIPAKPQGYHLYSYDKDSTLLRYLCTYGDD